MKKQTFLLALLVMTLAGGAAAASPDAVVTGPGQGVVIENPTPDNICPGSILKSNDDATYENGYAWAYAGEALPYYGAWAEGFSLSPGNGTVCGMKFILTQIGAQDGLTMDVYVWDEAGSNPNNVLSVTTGVNPGAISMWPNVSQHDVDINDVNVSGNYFVGWWGSWPGAQNGWYVAADESGFGFGLPCTNIAPGIGFPSGWQHPNVVSSFIGCQDLGIAVYESSCQPGSAGACCLTDGSCQMMDADTCFQHEGSWHGCENCSPDLCPPVPVEATSWGWIKGLYR